MGKRRPLVRPPWREKFLRRWNRLGRPAKILWTGRRVKNNQIWGGLLRSIRDRFRAVGPGHGDGLGGGNFHGFELLDRRRTLHFFRLIHEKADGQFAKVDGPVALSLADIDGPFLDDQGRDGFLGRGIGFPDLGKDQKVRSVRRLQGEGLGAELRLS